MEVHAHTHTPRKKWTHYFWEFLMLFLAVFAGFLAENQREHYVEHLREKQFINSLVNDIRVDTARLNRLIENRNIRELRLDSLTILLNGENADQHTKDIYFLATVIPRITLFQFTANDGTMQQLKNSGGLMPGYKTSLNEFNYRLVSVKNVNKGYRREARKLLLQATNLLNILKTQYHLK